MAEIKCRYFSGYKPCNFSDKCDRSQCASFSEVKENILIVHLGALGAVVRSTALLKAIKRKHPMSRLIWVTRSPAHLLLENHPKVDKVICTSELYLHPLTHLDYGAAYCIDKSLDAVRVVEEFKVKKMFGFKADNVSGAILPATENAVELWKLGLSNHEKFFVNKKTENQLVHEALELGEYFRDQYDLCLNSAERAEASARREIWRDSQKERILVGINVGCSHVIPYKKLVVKLQRELIEKIQSKYGSQVHVVLLGGREDLELAQEIARGLDVTLSPMASGLRDGMMSLSACDMVVTGDSLGLHLAVAFGKWVVSWFGPTCAHEIDLYDRGVKVQASVSCSPCWKRNCSLSQRCNEMVSTEELLRGIVQGVEWRSSLSKQPFQETYF